MEWSQDSADRPGELLRSPTRSCFLLLLLFLGRLSLPALPHLLGTSLSSLWSPPFLPHAPAVIPSSLTKVRLSFTLTLSHLTIWYYGQTALFLFLLAKTALANLPRTRSVALGLPFPFQQAQYAQIFSLKPASLCKLSAGLSSTNKSATSFLLSFSLTLGLLSPPCSLLRLSFYLNLTGRSGRNSFLFLSVLSGYKWVFGHTFFPGNDAADELVQRGALLASSAIPCSLSFPVYHIHFSLFSDWRRAVSSKFIDTQVSSISTEKFVLPRHACCIFSRFYCNGHSPLLSSYLSRIGRIENFVCSAYGHSPQDIFHLILYCPSTDSLHRLLFGDSLSLYDLWSRPWGVSRLRAPLSSTLPSSLRKDWTTTTSTTTTEQTAYEPRFSFAALRQRVNVSSFFVLRMFIFHSRESKLYRYISKYRSRCVSLTFTELLSVISTV